MMGILVALAEADAVGRREIGEEVLGGHLGTAVGAQDAEGQGGAPDVHPGVLEGLITCRTRRTLARRCRRGRTPGCRVIATTAGDGTDREGDGQGHDWAGQRVFHRHTSFRSLIPAKSVGKPAKSVGRDGCTRIEIPADCKQ